MTVGPIGIETTFSNVVKMIGRQRESILEVVEYLPDRQYTFKTDWPFLCQLRHVLDFVVGGAQIDHAPVLSWQFTSTWRIKHESRCVRNWRSR
jgi:hypothetical protein